jgi:hypothetical protein
MRILRHAQIDVTMNVYTEVSDAKTLQALNRLGESLARRRCGTLRLYAKEGHFPRGGVACDLGRGGRI